MSPSPFNLNIFQHVALKIKTLSVRILNAHLTFVSGWHKQMDARNIIKVYVIMIINVLLITNSRKHVSMLIVCFSSLLTIIFQTSHDIILWLIRTCPCWCCMITHPQHRPFISLYKTSWAVVRKQLSNCLDCLVIYSQPWHTAPNRTSANQPTVHHRLEFKSSFPSLYFTFHLSLPSCFFSPPLSH